MNKLKTRHWAMYSHGAGAGKSTFLGATARRPLVVVDTDGRFESVQDLAPGEVLYPSQFIDPLTLHEDLIEFIVNDKVASVAFDSLTKLYSVHARVGYMRARAGRSKNKATEMIDKANAMTVARDIAAYGTDIFYCWHTTQGLSGSGSSEVRDMVSSIELGRLDTSINVWLKFIHEKGRYGVLVDKARDFGGRPANTGFTIWDEPENYWVGGADKLERLIYGSFKSRAEAIKWASKKLDIPEDETEAEYDHIKEQVNPKSKSEMWVAWVQHVDEHVPQADDKDLRVEKNEKPVEATIAESPAADESEQELPAEPEVKAVAGETAYEHESLRAGLDVPDATIGKVVYAAATAKDDLTHVVDYLLRLKDYPFTDSQQTVIDAGNFKIIMDQKLRGITAQEMFDWLMKPEKQVETEEVLL